MPRKRKQRIGRNTRCPCGSGKKYKHCCLANDRRASTERSMAPADLPRPSRGDVVQDLTRDWPPDLTHHVLRVLTSSDEKQMREAFVGLPELLSAGGPLDHIRFDPDLLASVVERAISEGVDLEEDGGGLFEACAPTLGSPALVRDLIRDASSLVRDTRLPRDQREAAGMTALTTALVHVPEYENMPALESVMKVQLCELDDCIEPVLDSLDESIRRARSENLGVSAIVERVIAEDSSLVERFSKSPTLRGIASRQLRKAEDRCEQLIADGELPPMLTVAEVVRLTAWLLLAHERQERGQPGPTTPPACLTALVPEVTDRVVELSRDEQYPPEVREHYLALSQAMLLMPERCLLAGYEQATRKPPLYRHKRELELLHGLTIEEFGKPGALDELRVLQRKIGDDRAVALIDEARRDIEALTALRGGE